MLVSCLVVSCCHASRESRKRSINTMGECPHITHLHMPTSSSDKAGLQFLKKKFSSEAYIGFV